MLVEPGDAGGGADTHKEEVAVIVPASKAHATAQDNFSPWEKFDPLSPEVWSVDDYVKAVWAHWGRSVESLLNVGRVCSRAQEDKKLKPEKLGEIQAKMPFRRANFSKWVQIGKDERLNKPEIQRLLPPRYTTLYVITTLTDDELQLAVEENVIRSETTREAVVAWRDSHRQAKDFAARGERSVASPPIAPVNDRAQFGDDSETARDADQSELLLDRNKIEAAPSQPFIENRFGADGTEHEDHGQSEIIPAFTRTEAQWPSNAPFEVGPTGSEDVSDPATAPVEECDLSAAADTRPLSADEQRAFDAVMAAYEAAPKIVQQRVRQVLGNLRSAQKMSLLK
jgi:hypothetical protein